MMSDDPQVPKMPDPAEDNQVPGMAASQPPDPLPDETGPAAPSTGVSPASSQAEDSDYMLEIREQLRSEGLNRRTGSLMRRITGSLRRMTGPLHTPTGSLRGTTGPLRKSTGSLRGRTAPLRAPTGSLRGRTGSLRRVTSSLQEAQKPPVPPEEPHTLEQHSQPEPPDTPVAPDTLLLGHLTGSLKADPKAQPAAEPPSEMQEPPAVEQSAPEEPPLESFSEAFFAAPESPQRQLTGPLPSLSEEQAPEPPVESREDLPLARLTGSLIRGQEGMEQPEAGVPSEAEKPSASSPMPAQSSPEEQSRHGHKPPAIKDTSALMAHLFADLEENVAETPLLLNQQGTPEPEQPEDVRWDALAEIRQQAAENELPEIPITPFADELAPESLTTPLFTESEIEIPVEPPHQESEPESLSALFADEIAPELSAGTLPEETAPELASGASTEDTTPALSAGLFSEEPQPPASAQRQFPAGKETVGGPTAGGTSGGETTEGSDYMSEIRQSLRSEGSGGKTGGLFRRITSSLRRVTGSLRRATGPLPAIPVPPAETPETPEIPELPAPLELPEQTLTPTGVSDAFLTDRLTGVPAEEPVAALPSSEEEAFPEDFFKTTREEESPSLESLFAAEEEEPADTTAMLSELGMPDQPEAEEAEPDWMAEIRQETAVTETSPDEAISETPLAETAAPEPETPPQEPPGEKTVTRGSGPLSFLTGILRRPEEKRKPKQTGGLSDEMVTGRLERSLGTAPIQAQTVEPPVSETSAADVAAAEPTATEAAASSVSTAAEPASAAPASAAPSSAAPTEEGEISFDDLFYGDTGMLRPHTGMLELPPELNDQPVTLFGDQPGLPPLEESAAEPEIPPLFAEEEFVIDEDATLLEGLESRFDQFGEAASEPVTGLEEEAVQETPLPDISVEESAQLWTEEQAPEGTPIDGVTFTPEDVWGEQELPPAYQPGPRTGGNQVDNTLAASLMGGENMEMEEIPGFSQDQLLREALERSGGGDSDTSIEEMRAIALQGYQEADLTSSVSIAPVEEETEERPAETAELTPEDIEAEKARAAAAEATAAAVEAFEREEQESAPFSLRRWFASRTPVQKFLLAEAAVVALAVLIAVPFFIYLIIRGPVNKQVVSNYPSPRSLPADLPYPTGLQLPGGWSFPLQKSTFIKGQWTPTTSEWLEGTEMRRVVALPWNPQTQAVVNTFQGGEKVLVQLSNGQTVKYTVDQVKRVEANNSQILTDPNPSLVIILYQEKSSERWVVFCKP